MPSFIEELLPVAQKVCQAILDVRNKQKPLQISHKADQSPITKADIIAHQILIEALTKITPQIPILSEEGISSNMISQAYQYWLVDPLDGTRDFIAGLDEFSVNIALLENQRPVLAIVAIPAKAKIYYALKGQGAFLLEGGSVEPIHVSTFQVPLRVVVSRSHKSRSIQRFLDYINHYQVSELGSAYKCCLVAEGLADIYPRFSQTMIWDIAAGHLILQEAGGEIYCLDGTVLSYATGNSHVNPPFLAIGDNARLREQCLRFAQEAINDVR